jgi:hypothetical protein
MQEVVVYLKSQQGVCVGEDSPALGAEDTKFSHSGSRLVVGAVWLWWLYFAGLLVFGAFAQ